MGGAESTGWRGVELCRFVLSAKAVPADARGLSLRHMYRPMTDENMHRGVERAQQERSGWARTNTSSFPAGPGQGLVPSLAVAASRALSFLSSQESQPKNGA